MIHHNHAQGSEEWLAARRGVITGSRFKDARDWSDGLTVMQRAYVNAILCGKSQGEAMVEAGYKSQPRAEAVDRAISSGKTSKEYSAAALLYAMDLARERCGGAIVEKYQNAAMRMGTDQEPLARMAYEAHTGRIVEEVGFLTTDDRKFGLSPDGLIGDEGVLEIKTMVSSDTLFRAVVNGDISEYIDQINGYLWLLGRKWVDLVLWAPDLDAMGLGLTIKRIERNEEDIQALEDDLVAFCAIVDQYEAQLRKLTETKEKP